MIRLVCFDMDGVLFESKNFWMDLHKAFGTEEQGRELTRIYLHTDYAKLVHEVFWKLWRGKDARIYEAMVRQQRYMPGVEALFDHIKKNYWKTAIISSGSHDLAARAARDFGIDYVYANELIISKGRITGEFNWPLGNGGEKKVEILKELCTCIRATPKDVAFIGDGESDIPVLQFCGLPIAFNADSDKVKKAARFVVITKNLKDIIPHLQERDEF